MGDLSKDVFHEKKNDLKFSFLITLVLSPQTLTSQLISEMEWMTTHLTNFKFSQWVINMWHTEETTASKGFGVKVSYPVSFHGICSIRKGW